MDTHHRIVGILHIIEASFFLLSLFAITVFFSVITLNMSSETSILAMMMSLGTGILIPIILLFIGQLIAAVALLRGNKSAKIWVLIFGSFNLFNFPIGTALGVYTFWALLRDQDTQT